MDITETLHARTRAEWRQWLMENHATAREIWLVQITRKPGQAGISYLEAVEEALCFGWIDGIQKKLDAERNAQRFTPRRPKGNWTELNKDRARRLITQGKMTDAGMAVLPDLNPREIEIAPDILAALQADPQTWENYQRFPEIYRRIRIDHLEEVRTDPDVFRQRLERFVDRTRRNKMYGSWE